jgi:hypothetical protein
MKKVLFTSFALGLCLTANLMAQPNYVPTNGLVGWWPFNGNANDESGNGNNGTVNGATLTADRFGNIGNAFNFDGVNDYVEVPDNLSVNLIGDLTMSAWVNTQGDNGQNYQTIISKRETYWTWEYNMILSYHNGVIHENKMLTSRALGQGNQEQAWSTVSYSALNWEFWTVIYSSGQVKLYKNGILDQTQSFTLIPNQQNCPLLFGKNTLVDNSEQFFGEIDDIGIWNRALTEQEIANLYNGCSNTSITSQPAGTTANPNTTAQFSIGASNVTAYQWQTDLGVGFQNLNNAGQYSGATNATLTISNVTATNNNQQFRCIINANGCPDTSTVAILSVSTNGINELINQKNFSIFPNPAKSNFEIKTDLSYDKIEIRDIQGRIVQTESKNKVINISSLQKGTYIIRLFDDQSNVLGIQQFVKE